jgi:hypothetical protein
MGFDRRTVLRQMGLIALALGVNQTGLSSLAQKSRVASQLSRYYQALAESTPRKLALLVGINNYPHRPSLKGCITDVELQRELLIHRFGFNPQDILTLTGKEATREAIEMAFVEHLIKQASATDVVVFHFSGYGSQVKVPQSFAKGDEKTKQMAYQFVNSLVPSDEIRLKPGTSVRNDLLTETLRLMGRSLATDKLTLILDSSHQAPQQILQGNLRVRSFPAVSDYPHPEELAFQQQLKIQIKASRKGKKSPRPATILSLTGENQIATEVTWTDFSTGFFTYALTQYLWQVSPASRVWVTLTRTAEKLEPILGKQQQSQILNTSNQSFLTYYLLPEAPVGAEGIVTAIEDDGTIKLKLTGLPGTLLEHYGLNSCFTVDSGVAILQVRLRDGLTAKARLIGVPEPNNSQLQIGQQVQEFIRVLPRNLGLTVALDVNLERIERVDATSAFANITAVNSIVTAKGQVADCLLARVQATDSMVEGGYGLFSVGGVLLPNTVGDANEAVKSAVHRLMPKLDKLLAAKLWRLTANEDSSRLAVRATLEMIEQTPQALIRRETRRPIFMTCPDNNLAPAPSHPVACSVNLSSVDKNQQSLNRTITPINLDTSILPHLIPSTDGSFLPSLSRGSRIQYRLENNGDRPLYFLLFGIDPDGEAIALYSYQLVNQLESSNSQALFTNQVIQPGERLIIPHPSTSFSWIVSGAVGLAEIQIIFAPAPFTKTLESLSNSQHPQGDKEQIINLPNPLKVAQAMLQDLHAASAAPIEMGFTSDSYALDVNAWATLSFVYQIV